MMATFSKKNGWWASKIRKNSYKKRMRNFTLLEKYNLMSSNRINYSRWSKRRKIPKIWVNKTMSPQRKRNSLNSSNLLNTPIMSNTSKSSNKIKNSIYTLLLAKISISSTLLLRWMKTSQSKSQTNSSPKNISSSLV